MDITGFIVCSIFVAGLLGIALYLHLKEKRELLKALDEKSRNFNIPNWVGLREQCRKGNLTFLKETNDWVNRMMYIYNKYPHLKPEVADKIVHRLPFLGMSVEMLKDIYGTPSEVIIELDSATNKTKHEVVYGFRSYGSIYKFENDELVKFPMRNY